MRHYVLTRSSFGPDVSLEENKHRLELLKGVTVPALRAQLNQDFAWVVLVDPDDPILKRRVAAIKSAGVPTVIAPSEGMIVRGRPDKPYGPWAKHLRWDKGPILTTRLDDDDMLAPRALLSVRAAAEQSDPSVRHVWSLPVGWRIVGGMAQMARWPIPMFCTLQAPAGDETTIYAINHLGAANLAPLEPATEEPSWAWVRHEATRSSTYGKGLEDYGEGGWRRAAKPIGDDLRARFPGVDWRLIESQKARP